MKNAEFPAKIGKEFCSRTQRSGRRHSNTTSENTDFTLKIGKGKIVQVIGTNKGSGEGTPTLYVKNTRKFPAKFFARENIAKEIGTNKDPSEGTCTPTLPHVQNREFPVKLGNGFCT